MSIKRRAQRAGRRFLAYPRVRRVSLAIVARVPAVRDMGNAVLGEPLATTKKKAVDIRPGPMFYGDVQGRRLPIVLIVAVGLGGGDTETLARQIELAQLTTGTFRPLFVVDSGELAPFRHRNYAVEAVMTAEAYGRVNPHDAYSEYLYERVSAIADGYRAQAVVPLPIQQLAHLSPSTMRLIGAIGR